MTISRSILGALLGVALGCLAQIAAGAVTYIYVDNLDGNDANNGSAWGTTAADTQAVKSLKRAADLAAAALSAGNTPEIHAAARGLSYFPTDGVTSLPTDPRSVSVAIPAGTRMYGGFNGLGDPSDPDGQLVTGDPSVLSGDLCAAGILTGPDCLSYHLLRIDTLASSQTTIKNFEFRNADANETSGSTGAGIWATGGSLRIQSCNFSSLVADGNGGAVSFVSGPGTLSLDRAFAGARKNSFTQCKSGAHGGAGDGGGVYAVATSLTVNQLFSDSCSAGVFPNYTVGATIQATVATACFGCGSSPADISSASQDDWGIWIQGGHASAGSAISVSASQSATFQNSVFFKNVGAQAVIAVSPTIKASVCRFDSNSGANAHATFAGTDAGSTCTIRLCRFFNGGEVEQGSVTVTGAATVVSHSEFSTNHTRHEYGISSFAFTGSDAFSCKVLNCLFDKDTIPTSYPDDCPSPGVECNDVSNIKITTCPSAIFDNCTLVGRIADNLAIFPPRWAIAAQGSTLNNTSISIHNSIIYFYWDRSFATAATTTLHAISSATFSVLYSDLQDTAYNTSSNNLGTDPRFRLGNGDVSPFELDSTPSSPSPCINAGLNSYVPADAADVDFDSNTSEAISQDLSYLFTLQYPGPRISGTVDMGAFEFRAGGCAADFNQDGRLEVQDIFAFLDAWFGTCVAVGSDPCQFGSANFNHSANGLEVQDIFDFLSAWFNGC